ncbi:MAG: hypothetical protein ABIQ35_08595 [Verrucomicrobiota bacterium]
MNQDTELNLQAYLDEELSEGEARKISVQLKNDAQANALIEELRFIKVGLRENELELKLPESREFYWSKIQREINRDVKVASPRATLRWWKPGYVRFAGVFAGACALLMLSFFAFDGQNDSRAMDEVEGTGEDMGSITYHSDKENMTVVYLFDRDPERMIDSK